MPDPLCTENVTIVLYVRTDKIGSRCEKSIKWEREDWDSMTDEDREQAMHEALWDSGMVDWGYEVKP